MDGVETQDTGGWLGERIFSLVRLAASHVFPGARAALCVTPHDCRPCHVCVGPACAWGGRWYQQSGRIESSYLGNAELLRLRQLIIRRGTSPVVAATRGGRHPCWNALVCPTEGGGGRCRGRGGRQGKERRASSVSGAQSSIQYCNSTARPPPSSPSRCSMRRVCPP